MTSKDPSKPNTSSDFAAPYLYGGQAVIEGVMIRGRRFACVAARRPNGELTHRITPLSTMFTGKIRRFPLLRGVLILAETLTLGMKALAYSTNVQLEEEGQELGGWSLAFMLTVSLGLAIGLFFLLPLFASILFERVVDSHILSNLVEGVVRLAVFLAYVWIVGFIPDIRRVFAYHGAEHMTVKAYEAGDPLEVQSVRKYSTAHPRCGTAFLLTVMVVAVIVFVWLGRPSLPWLVTSRLVLIPLIAALAYETIRFSASHQKNLLVRMITVPNLALQMLTTRQPQDDQIEVAIHAMETALAADRGEDTEASLDLPADDKSLDPETPG